MEIMYRWLVLMDVSNCTQHIHQRNPDWKQLSSENESWLEWLVTTFLDYLADVKRQRLAKQFLTEETYEALVITTCSNVECVIYLLRDVLPLCPNEKDVWPYRNFLWVVQKICRQQRSDNVQAVLSGIEKNAKNWHC